MSPPKLLFVCWGGQPQDLLLLFVDIFGKKSKNDSFVSFNRPHIHSQSELHSCLKATMEEPTPSTSKTDISDDLSPPLNWKKNGHHYHSHQLRPVQPHLPKMCHQCQSPGRHRLRRNPPKTMPKVGKSTHISSKAIGFYLFRNLPMKW